MTTARNRTEPPVNRRLGFEAAPNQTTSVNKLKEESMCAFVPHLGLEQPGPAVLAVLVLELH